VADYPAKAVIQLIENPAWRDKTVVVVFAGFNFLLDSRLRGNNGDESEQ